MAYKKTYVEVVASFREDGLLLPREIVWEDGRRYEICLLYTSDAADE